MREIDEIGMFYGKCISQMSREELLEFAKWAGKKIEELENKVEIAQPYLIDRELKKGGQIKEK